MTALTRVLRWLRGPRVAPDPAPDLSWLDRKDGLDTRRSGPLRRTRYDVEWPSVLAAEVGTVVGVSADEWSSLPPVFVPRSFVGGDLAAMAAPLPGMARDDLGTYAEPVEVHIEADVSRFREAMESITRVVGLTVAAQRDIPVAVAEIVWTVRDVRAAMAAYDLGLGPVRRSDPPLYVACLADAGAEAWAV